MRGHPLPHFHLSALTEKHLADEATKSQNAHLVCPQVLGKKLELVFLACEGAGERGACTMQSPLGNNTFSPL